MAPAVAEPPPSPPSYTLPFVAGGLQESPLADAAPGVLRVPPPPENSVPSLPPVMPPPPPPNRPALEGALSAAPPPPPAISSGLVSMFAPHNALIPPPLAPSC